MSRILALLLIFTLVLPSLNAQEVKAKKKRKKRGASQTALVRNSGAAVYKERSFDADPITYLEAGQKVRISRKKYPGKDGFGLFYKVVVSKKLKGYISDVDVVPRFKKTKYSKKVKENPDFEEMTKEPEVEQEPMLFTRYFGGQVSMVDFTEEFGGQNLNAQTLVYGLKMAGPGFLLEEVPLDIDLLLSMTPPSYYDDKLATAPTTGFFLITNLALKVPFIDTPNSIVYYSLGMTGSYTNFTLTIGPSVLDVQEVRLGAIAGLGAAMRFSRKYFIQVDWKYYYEKTQYMGYGTSFGLQY